MAVGKLIDYIEWRKYDLFTIEKIMLYFISGVYVIRHNVVISNVAIKRALLYIR